MAPALQVKPVEDDSTDGGSAKTGKMSTMIHKAEKKLNFFSRNKARRGSIGNKDKVLPGVGEDGVLKSEVGFEIDAHSTTSSYDDDAASHAATLPVRMDKFGFILEDVQHQDNVSEIGSTTESATGSTTGGRKMASDEEMAMRLERGQIPKHRFVKNFARKGIPDNLRQKAWLLVTSVDAIMAEKEGKYHELVEKSSNMGEASSSSNPAWDVIERDIRRTFPKHYMFQDSTLDDELDGVALDEDDARFAEGGQASLRRLLRAYSLYDSDVGYCQGMNFIAAMFLTFLGEEESFWMFHTVMNNEPYNLRELFSESMAGTQEVLYIAEQLIQQFLPKLYKHLETEHIHMSMFITQWLMTIYTSTFPFELVARVWDSFLVEGWKVVYRTMLALLDHAQEDLMTIGFDDILSYLREYPAKVDGNTIMAASLKISLKRRHIQKYATEWRTLTKSGDIRVDVIDHRPSMADSTDGVSVNVPNFYKAYHFVSKLKHQRREIEIDDLSKKLIPVIGTSKFAVMLYNVYTPEECEEMAQKAEKAGFEEALVQGPGGKQVLRTDIRSCKRCMMDDDILAEDLLDRVECALSGSEMEEKFKHAPWITFNRDGGEQKSPPLHVAGVNERLRYLKYDADDFFAAHQDNHFRRGPEYGERAGECSHVTVQVYLNDKFKGGATRMKGGRRFLDVQPRIGAVLLFDHDILHEGCKITSGQKLIIRSDIMYTNKPQGH